MKYYEKKNLETIKSIPVTFLSAECIAGAGASFAETMHFVQNICGATMDQTIVCSFNGIRCHVKHDTNLDHLWRDYNIALSGFITEVGPICVEEHSPEFKTELEIYRLKRRIEMHTNASASISRDLAEAKRQLEELQVKGAEA